MKLKAINKGKGKKYEKNKKILGKVLGLSLLLLAGFQLVARAETNGLEAENTKPPLQIINQTGLKVVVQVNYSVTVPNGISKPWSAR
jgi:hypothetical protein